MQKENQKGVVLVYHEFYITALFGGGSVHSNDTFPGVLIGAAHSSLLWSNNREWNGSLYVTGESEVGWGWGYPTSTLLCLPIPAHYPKFLWLPSERRPWRLREESKSETSQQHKE